MKFNYILTSLMLSLSFLTSSCSGGSTSAVFKELDSLATDSSFKIFIVKEEAPFYEYNDGKLSRSWGCSYSAGDRRITGLGGIGDNLIQQNGKNYYVFDDGYDGNQPCIEQDKVESNEFQYTYIPNSILDKYILVFNDQDGNEVKMMKISLGNHFPEIVEALEYYYEDAYNKETNEAYVLVTKEAIYFGCSCFSMIANDYSIDEKGNLTEDIMQVDHLDGNCGGGYSLCYVPAKRALFNEDTEKFYFLSDVRLR